jgi:phytoene/squalene synthetase
MTALSKLPAAERAKRYREFAEDAEKWARATDKSARQSYLVMAQTWRKLAEQVGSEQH